MTQDEAFRVLTIGKNVFLTGAAGSGKTYVLRRYVSWLQERQVEVAVTASTGIAATHIGGQTIHSWSGIGVKDFFTKYDLERFEQDERLYKRFTQTRVLVIDEVSMLSHNTLGLVDQVLRVVLHVNEPFGGIQVVLCGDFFQLPPVVRGNMDAPFAFLGEAWHTLNLHVCYLTEQYRQGDAQLLAVLNGIRFGAVTQALHEVLATRVGVPAPDNIPYLYTHNVDVDRLNQEKLSALPGHGHVYEMRTKGSKKNIEILKRGVLAQEILVLKKGASVMFIKNHPLGLYVNGTLGVVEDTSHGGPIIRTHNGVRVEAEPESWKLVHGENTHAEVIQVPLRLAWAVTIHKSQGMTLDAARMDLTKTFVEGQGYVALSRVRALSGLYLDGVNNAVFMRHPLVAEEDVVFQSASARIAGRLASTPSERLDELSRAFVLRMGGREPKKGEQKGKKQKHARPHDTYGTTLVLLREHKNIDAVVAIRNMTMGTILKHIERLASKNMLSRDEVISLASIGDNFAEAYEEVCDAISKAHASSEHVSVYEMLGGKYSYDEIRIVRIIRSYDRK